MMFSTKAEYGVRVMAHLAAHHGDGPVSLGAVAEAEGLPLAYLEHLIQRLRRAGLVESRRGAHGGYSLARAPEDMTMAQVVGALEGQIAPIDCISTGADGVLTCARESDSDHVCPTKLLWTRVQNSIVQTLEGLPLSDLTRTSKSKVPA